MVVGNYNSLKLEAVNMAIGWTVPVKCFSWILHACTLVLATTNTRWDSINSNSVLPKIDYSYRRTLCVSRWCIYTLAQRFTIACTFAKDLKYFWLLDRSSMLAWVLQPPSRCHALKNKLSNTPIRRCTITILRLGLSLFGLQLYYPQQSFSAHFIWG